jgi:hypothetical protein
VLGSSRASGGVRLEASEVGGWGGMGMGMARLAGGFGDTAKERAAPGGLESEKQLW